MSPAPPPALAAVRARPVVVASLLAMAGALLGLQGPGLPGAIGLLAIALPAAIVRSPASLLRAGALAAGVAAGALEEASAGRQRDAMESMRRRLLPPAAALDLEVEEVEENPFRGRGSLLGRARDGSGVLCLFAGPLDRRIAPGARVRAAGRPFLPRPPANPGEADEPGALAARGAAVALDLRSAENLAPLTPAPRSLRALLHRLRHAGARRLGRLLPGDAAPVAAALLFGIRGAVSERVRRAFEATGTLHILAISGMHVVLLAGALHAALRRSGVGPRTSAALTLLCAAAYVPVAGGGAPIRRAVYSIAFYAAALLRGRRPDSFGALAGAALFIALLDPADVPSLGFRLSFAATASIAWLAGSFERRFGRRHRLLARFPLVRRERPLRILLVSYALRAIPTALAAWLATAALVAHAFGRANPWGVAANLVAGPLFSLALPLAGFTALGAGFLAPATAATIRAAMALLDRFAALPGATIQVPFPSLAAVLLWSAGCVALRSRGRIAAAAFGLAIALWPRPPPPRETAAYLLDVGHGQACLLRFGDGRHALVDAGSRTRPLAGRRSVVPALRALGVRRIDLAVCSHADADHWNAFRDVFASFPVGRLLVGPDPPPPLLESARRFGVEVRRARDGEALLEGAGARLVAILPPDRAGASGNDRSLVLRFETPGGAMLLPGDREEGGLDALLDHGLAPAETLLAPHHGAANGRARAFGRAVRPRRLLVSGIPEAADETTLRAYGAAEIHATHARGCLRIEFLPEGGAEVSPVR